MSDLLTTSTQLGEIVQQMLDERFVACWVSQQGAPPTESYAPAGTFEFNLIFPRATAEGLELNYTRGTRDPRSAVVEFVRPTRVKFVDASSLTKLYDKYAPWKRGIAAGDRVLAPAYQAFACAAWTDTQASQLVAVYGDNEPVEFRQYRNPPRYLLRGLQSCVAGICDAVTDHTVTIRDDAGRVTFRRLSAGLVDTHVSCVLPGATVIPGDFLFAAKPEISERKALLAVCRDGAVYRGPETSSEYRRYLASAVDWKTSRRKARHVSLYEEVGDLLGVTLGEWPRISGVDDSDRRAALDAMETEGDYARLIIALRRAASAESLKHLSDNTLLEQWASYTPPTATLAPRISRLPFEMFPAGECREIELGEGPTRTRCTFA